MRNKTKMSILATFIWHIIESFSQNSYQGEIKVIQIGKEEVHCHYLKKTSFYVSKIPKNTKKKLLKVINSVRLLYTTQCKSKQKFITFLHFEDENVSTIN